MLTILFDGVAYGMLLFILAVGLAVTMGLMNFINLAHGAFAMLGGYITVLLMQRLDVPFLLCLPIAFVGVALLAWDKASFQPDANGTTTGWAVLAVLLACFSAALDASAWQELLANLKQHASIDYASADDRRAFAAKVDQMLDLGFMPAIRRIVEGRLADGIVLDTTQPQDPRVRYLLEHNFPFVTFGRTELVSEHPYVDADNEQAAFLATQYLIDRGHRRIALISPPLRLGDADIAVELP